MNKQLNLKLGVEKQYPAVTINARGIYILGNLKKKLPNLYNHIFNIKSDKSKIIII